MNACACERENDCRTFETYLADTPQVEGHAALSRRAPSRGGNRGFRRKRDAGGSKRGEEGRNGCPGKGEKGGTNAFRTQRLYAATAAAVVAPSESFMRFAPIGGAFYSHGALCIFTTRG